MKQAVASGLPSKPLKRRQQNQGFITLPRLTPSASSPSLPSIGRLPLPMCGLAPAGRSAGGLLSPELICSKKWTTEQRRLLHHCRERSWLQRKAKHQYIDFSDHERAALRRYFDALAGDDQKLRLDKLENMLISLGLADTREEVADIVERVGGDGSRELDFEEYLEIVRALADSDIFLVFKAMTEGTLGDPSLNFQTVISAYRRKLILDATGARGVSSSQQELGYKILNNFAGLQQSRHAEAEALEMAKGETPASAAKMAAAAVLPFDKEACARMGGPLSILWRGVCHEERLVSSRPSSVEGKSRSRRTVQRPMSPMEVVDGIVKVKNTLRVKSRCGTVIVRAPELGEDSHNNGGELVS